MTDAISTQRLTKCYSNRRVVDAVDLRIPAGCVYGLLGRNGAGKSTLIKMLLGMVWPDSGQSELLGHNSLSLDAQARGKIAYLAEGHPLYRWMSVRQAGRFVAGFHTVWHKQYFSDTLAHFQISDDARIGKLSNGQRAQVSLALALASDPELLVLDDPTLGLDTVVRRDFLESMIELIQRAGRTILFSSHILGDIERVADRIGVMVDGVLRVDCPTEHFKSALRRVVLRFAGEVPEFPSCAGLVSQHSQGGKLELVIVDYGSRHEALAEGLGPLSIDVVEMNLEDAFIAYTRGERRPLPVLKRELAHDTIADF